MYKTPTELKREFAIKHLFRISKKLDNLDDISKINDVIRILKQPHDSGQWIERELIDIDGRFIDADGRFVVIYECSNCHYAFMDIQHFHYCPQCGVCMVEKPEMADSK